MAFEWIVANLDDTKFDLSFILLNPHTSLLETYLEEHQIPVSRIKFSGKSDYLKALFKLWIKLLKTSPDVIHCHLFDASLIGLLAAKLVGIKKRIYTRHHSTYNWNYNKKGVKWDRFINYLATDIVAISKNVESILLEKERVNQNKIHFIHHGFDLEVFMNPSTRKIENLDIKYDSMEKWPVIGVIARWIEWKGIQFIIPSFQQLLKKYPNAFLILVNTSGSYKSSIQKLLDGLPKECYCCIDFEIDISNLYQLFDVYVHTPINKESEAFGQTYVEALAAGVPSVFTISGVASELITHNENAIVVPYQDSPSITKAIDLILSDRKLRDTMIANGKKSVNAFNLSTYLRKLEHLYSI